MAIQLRRARQVFVALALGVWAGMRAMLADALAALGGPDPLRIPARWRTPLEILALAVMTLVFTIPVHTGLGADDLPGLEHQRLSGIILPVRDWLVQSGELAMWNPYLQRGEPLMGNPFNYLWNPVASLPVFLLGPTLGTRWAVVLHLFAAGVGAWLWGKAARLSWLARLFCGEIYAVSGGIISKFVIGHFQLGLSLAWVPWAMAGLQFAVRSDIRADPRALRRATILMAAGTALTFVSGNVFYTLPLIVSLGLASLLYVFKVDLKRRWPLRVDRQTIITLAIGAVLTVGFSAVLLFPVWAGRNQISGHADDTGENGSQTMAQGFANYLINDEGVYQSRLMGLSPWLGDSYSYMGLIPVALMALAPAAALARAERRKIVIILFGLLVLMVAWAGKRYSVIGLIYPLLPWLRQWRFLGRFLAMGNIFIACLSGLGVQFVMDRFDAFNPPLGGAQASLGRTARNLLLTVAVAAVLWAGVSEAAASNIRLLEESPSVADPSLDAAVAWLAASHPEPAYVWIDNTLDRYAYPSYLNHIYRYSLGEGWSPRPMPDTITAPLPGIDPQFQINRPGGGPVLPYTRKLVTVSDSISVYDVSSSRPFAFVIANQNLKNPNRVPEPMVPIHPVSVTANSIAFEVDAAAGDGLVVANVVAYPGWQAFIDGKTVPLVVLNSSLAVPLERGHHAYVFRFIDYPFIAGLAVTVLTLIGCAVWLRWPVNKGEIADSAPGY